MTIKRRILIAVSSLLATVMACLLLIAFIPKIGVSADEAILKENVEIKEVYATGTILETPSAKISYKGNDYEANAKVILCFPDGSAYEGGSFNLNQTGKYKLIYSANVGDDVITASKDFKVENLPYVVPSSSSATYIETLKTQNPNQEISKGGVSVALGVNAKFKYNKVVDISGSTAETPLITFSPYQFTQYMLDENNRPVNEAKEFTLRITDAYDENNYVEVYFLDRDGSTTQPQQFLRPYPYVSAGPSGQTMYCLDSPSRYNANVVSKYGTGGNGKIVTVNGVQYCAVYKDFGVSVGYAPIGEKYYKDGNTENEVVAYEQGTGGNISIYYDYKENAVYYSSPTRNGTDVATKSILVCDVDDIGLYSSPFKGFTTGEVYLSMWAGGYLSDSYHYEISEIYGTKGRDLAENVNVVNDVQAPVIRFEKEVPEILYAKQGAPVLIIPTTVYDVNSLGDARVSVWYNYGTNLAEWVNVVDGKFVPVKTGNYTVEYLAEDAYGNKTIETVSYVSVKSDVLRFEVSDISDDVSAGSLITLDKGSATSLNGNVEISISATLPNGNVIEIGGDGKLLVEYAGVYTVEYKYNDGFISDAYSYKFTSKASNLVNIDTPVLPEYFIKDASYTLDTVYASTYTGQSPELKATTVFMSEDGGAYKEIDYTDFKVNAETKIRFKYVYNNAEIYSDEMPVVDVGFEGRRNINKAKYFIGDVSYEATKDGVIYTSTSEDSITELKFINVLSFESFNFEFTVPSGAGFERLEIILTDYYDRDKNLVINYGNKGASTAFGFAEYATEIAKAFEGNKFAVSYVSSANQVAERNGNAYDFVSEFSTDKILLTVKLYGTTKNDSKIMISNVGHQDMNDDTRDKKEGYFTFQNLFGGVNAPNSIVTVYALSAVDVLTPYLAKNATISVRLPDNGQQVRYATSVDGIELYNVSATRDYQIELEELGEYLVEYYYTDQKGNSVPSNYNILCMDNKNPTLTLEGGYNEKTIKKVNVGETVQIVTYNASDDRTAVANLKVLTYILKANGEFLAIEDNQFVADKAGDYVVYYYCYDADNNYAVAQYTVRAK